MTDKRIVAIALGDPAGVGPEIAMKTALDGRVRESCRPVLFGDRRALDAHITASGLPFSYRAFDSMQEVRWSADETPVIHVDSLADGLRLGQVDGVYGAAAIAALSAAVACALAGQVSAVVGGPIHEVAIRLAGIHFDGHPSFLARSTGTPPDEVFLMLCYGRTRIVHATLHVGVRDALDMLTRERIAKVIGACHRALRQLGCQAPRIGVSGVNPHAGEAGLFGREEIEIISPAIEDAKAAGIDLIGPIGADTLLMRDDCDAFIVMLHDQGHIAAKLAAPHTVAALSIGTPVIFSSVGHGTAMDIAGAGAANPEAMIQAVLQVANAAAHRTGQPSDLHRPAMQP
jgi:4-hydroxythreonine-4-phosphate dehydrogenase